MSVIKQPLVFNCYDKDGNYDCTVVKIAAPYDWKEYKAKWMCDPLFDHYENTGGKICVPDVDLCESTHRFHSENDALRFIKAWWATQEV